MLEFYERRKQKRLISRSLVIKGFGALKAVETVQEAIQKYVEVETLSGDNHCSICDL